MQVGVVTPWFPSPAHPYRGLFVKQQVDAVRRQAVNSVEVVVPEIFPSPRGPVPTQVLTALERLGRRDAASAFPTAGGVTRVPSAVPSSAGPLGRATAFAQSLHIRQLVDPHSYDVIHAHVGVPTGLSVSQVLESPLVVTEHQSALPRLMQHQDIRRAYRELVEQSARFLTVSEMLKDVLIQGIGDDWADQVDVLPNVVDFESLPLRPATPTSYKDWLYVGTLVEHKGVGLLLDAFRSYRSRHEPDSTLTLVGDGPMRAYAEAFAADHQLEDSISITGGLSHGGVARHLGSADVLVHLSPFETFGIAPIEAIATGTPVVVRRNGGSESAWGDIADMCGLMLDAAVNHHEVADAVAELRNKPNKLNLTQARQTLEGRFSSDVIGRRLVEIYRASMR